MSLSKKDSEFYFKKAIKITRYLMFYYLLTTLSAFANSGLNFGTIIKLFLVILLFQVQYNVRWYSSISVGALGFFVFTQIAAFGAMILSLIRSVSYLGFSRFDSSISYIIILQKTPQPMPNLLELYDHFSSTTSRPSPKQYLHVRQLEPCQNHELQALWFKE